MSETSDFTPACIEALEARSLRSASPLSPSAVEGTYRGELSYGGTTRELKLSVSSTSETLTVVGIGAEKIALSPHQFHRLLDGSFTYNGKIAGESLSLTGSLSSSNGLITGTVTGSGRVVIEGTFSLEKI